MTDHGSPAPSLSLGNLFNELEARDLRRRDADRRARAEAAARQELERQHYQQRLLTEADRALFLRRVKTEFEHREREVMLISFPSDFCADGGRHINHELPGWETTLPGYARRVYDFWHDDLRLGGFGCNARVISFGEDGIPQDIGLFIDWPDMRP